MQQLQGQATLQNLLDRVPSLSQEDNDTPPRDAEVASSKLESVGATDNMTLTEAAILNENTQLDQCMLEALNWNVAVHEYGFLVLNAD